MSKPKLGPFESICLCLAGRVLSALAFLLVFHDEPTWPYPIVSNTPESTGRFTIVIRFLTVDIGCGLN